LIALRSRRFSADLRDGARASIATGIVFAAIDRGAPATEPLPEAASHR